jgi:hypothetical protein
LLGQYSGERAVGKISIEIYKKVRQVSLEKFLGIRTRRIHLSGIHENDGSTWRG